MNIIAGSEARPKRTRKPSLAAVLKEAAKAGAAVSGATLNSYGSVSLRPTSPPRPAQGAGSFPHAS